MPPGCFGQLPANGTPGSYRDAMMGFRVAKTYK
jgi:hypothetical protein